MPTAPTIYDALRAYYRFEDASNIGADSAGYLNTGTLSSAGQSTAGTGRLGTYGLRTTAAGGKMTVADDPSLRQFASVRVSVSVWVNLDMGLSSMWGTPVFADKTGGSTRGYFLGVLSGGGNVVSFRVHNSAGTPYTASYTESATSGWVHIVGVYEGSLVRIYRNGVSQNTAAADGTLRIGTDALDGIGLGFQGVIDELQVWGRMLTSADVTALYNGGAGLALVFPDTERVLRTQASEGRYIDEPYAEVANSDGTDLAYSNPITPNGVPTLQANAYTTKQMVYSALTSPYIIRDSPKRIYIDPHPLVVSATVDSGHTITATGNAGPTDALDLLTWWEIELLPGQVFVVAQREAHSDFQTNHNQVDSWVIPTGQNWRNLSLRFFMQSVDDGSQVWASDPFTMSDPFFDNAPIDVPAYDDPQLSVVSADADVAHHATVVGRHVGGSGVSPNLQTWWEVDLSGDGSFRCLMDPRYPVAGMVTENLTDVFDIPVGVNLNGRAIRFAARAQYDSQQVWYSAPRTLVGPNWDNGSFHPSPLPPGPPAGPEQGPTRGRPGPGVYRVPVRDNSRR